MNFYHYSSAPFVLDRRQTYTHGRKAKPHGLWLSAEDDTEDSHGWKEWCQGEDFRLDGLTYRTRVELAADARVVRIATPQELDAFTRRFGSAFYGSNYIDWPAVARQYGAIVIAPYQWSKRLDNDCFWYYTWDCALACVWDLSIVLRVAEEVEDACIRSATA